MRSFVTMYECGNRFYTHLSSVTALHVCTAAHGDQTDGPIPSLHLPAREQMRGKKNIRVRHPNRETMQGSHESDRKLTFCWLNQVKLEKH